jgi:ribosomal protein S18 acetylase RimI-like enzyme
VDGAIVGLLVLVVYPGYLLIENIAVQPSAQRRGIGSRLLLLAEDEARANGLSEIRLYTNEGMTENLAFYPRHGYRETRRAEENGFRRVFFSKVL